MPKGGGYGKGDKGVMDKGPGDMKQRPQVPAYRGESGTSDAKGSEETKSVTIDR